MAMAIKGGSMKQMEKDNKTLAKYIATFITYEFEEAEEEDIDPLSEVIFQALEAYEGGAR